MGTTGVGFMGDVSLDITPPAVPWCVHKDYIMSWI